MRSINLEVKTTVAGFPKVDVLSALEFGRAIMNSSSQSTARVWLERSPTILAVYGKLNSVRRKGEAIATDTGTGKRSICAAHMAGVSQGNCGNGTQGEKEGIEKHGALSLKFR